MPSDHSSVASFVSKTYDIFDSKPNDDSYCWGGEGKVIVIKDIDSFARNILPQYFKHSNFQSFVRQLHIYDFHKTATLDPNHVGYANEYFRQGNRELISEIKMKTKTPKKTRESFSRAMSRTSSTTSLENCKPPKNIEVTPVAPVAEQKPNEQYFDLFAKFASKCGQQLDISKEGDILNMKTKRALDREDDSDSNKRSRSALLSFEDADIFAINPPGSLQGGDVYYNSMEVPIEDGLTSPEFSRCSSVDTMDSTDLADFFLTHDF